MRANKKRLGTFGAGGFTSGDFASSCVVANVKPTVRRCSRDSFWILLQLLASYEGGDTCETNSEKVQQRLFLDSSSALGLIRRTGTGRLKHIQIKQFFLQNLLRSGVFTVHKIHTRINPGDLNTKRLGGERGNFLGRLIGLYQPNEDEKNDDSAVRQIKKINRATKEQCVRLIQMAGLTMNMCMQLKGCVQADNKEDIVNVSNNSDGISDVEMLWWTTVEWTLNVTWMVIYYVLTAAAWIPFFMVQIAGVATITLAVMFLLWGPMIWAHFQFLRGFARRNAPWLMGQRHRFREQRQEGDFMVDIESVFETLDEYLTGQTQIGAATTLLEPKEMQVEEPQAEEPQAEPDIPQGGGEPFGPDDDIGEIAYQHAGRLNGVRPHEHEVPMVRGAEREKVEDEEMEEESPSARRRRYLSSTMDEVSDPDEWATVHYGNREVDDYERMVAFSQANRQRLNNALHTLLFRRENAEVAGNWEEIEAFDRAINEVQALRDIA
eukprot:s3453_g6.t1